RRAAGAGRGRPAAPADARRGGRHRRAADRDRPAREPHGRGGRLTGRRTLLAGVALLALGCTELPRDPEGTLARVRGGVLRAGGVESPPWLVRTEGGASGPEARVVADLAEELGAEFAWSWGALGDQMEALERFELDLVAGGLTRASL